MESQCNIVFGGLGGKLIGGQEGQCVNNFAASCR